MVDVKYRTMQIQEINITLLKPAEYNPRKMNKKEAEDLKASIEEFGFVDPIIVNKNPERENVIIGGHQRVSVAKMLGYVTVPVFYIDLSLENEKRLNLRLNKNLGQWDYDLLANLDEEMLKDVGFSEKEMDEAFNLDDMEVEPEVEFAKEIFEENNYIVFLFGNEFDWNTVKNELDLQPVKIREVGGEEKKVGIGRVVDGNKLIKLINAKNKI